MQTTFAPPVRRVTIVDDARDRREYKDVHLTQTADQCYIITDGAGHILATYPHVGHGRWISVGTEGYDFDHRPAS